MYVQTMEQQNIWAHIMRVFSTWVCDNWFPVPVPQEKQETNRWTVFICDTTSARTCISCFGSTPDVEGVEEGVQQKFWCPDELLLLKSWVKTGVVNGERSCTEGGERDKLQSCYSSNDKNAQNIGLR